MVGPLLTLRTDGSAMDTGGAKFFDELRPADCYASTLRAE